MEYCGFITREDGLVSLQEQRTDKLTTWDQSGNTTSSPHTAGHAMDSVPGARAALWKLNGEETAFEITQLHAAAIQP